MAAVSFQSHRIGTHMLHSPASRISYRRSLGIPRLPPAAPSHRRLSSLQPESSITSIFESEIGVASEEEMDKEVDPTAEVRFLDQDVDAAAIKEWDLDFCSRPILDDRGKKVWELVVCDGSLSLQYTRYFPNNVINSITLRDAIAAIAQDLGVPLPEKIRFFRSQMQTIITKACNELGIKPVPSKRCISLFLWLEERYETVYTRHPGFQKGSKPLLALDNPFPMELPENLFGEKWAFVQLPFSAVREEISQVKRYAFGGTLDLDLLGFEIEGTTLVPGVAVASSRAKPLAEGEKAGGVVRMVRNGGTEGGKRFPLCKQERERFDCSFAGVGENWKVRERRGANEKAWMNGLEVCSMEADSSRGCLILSVGVATRYVYATYKKTAATTQEAEAWETAKKACGGLHFLAIQQSLDSDDCVGFWILLDLPAPPV
ncbi:hypothetical protein AXF42_Ash020416 [Apostasia shenzhenica]|uniref:Protein TAB2 homolog, chloroplastic n=1 Tax=Apostasia shenzhenica TaxID=1088818 RepID=A0A2I0AAC1_9ASPA|nr:hypothetical protein AXF42_Ash020416 [Apostasia shenzhenica]